ncbi:MAG: hypothetical protein ACTH7C_13270, partial [Cobetia marina]
SEAGLSGEEVDCRVVISLCLGFMGGITPNQVLHDVHEDLSHIALVRGLASASTIARPVEECAIIDPTPK